MKENIAQMVSFFESSSKAINKNNVKMNKSPPKVNIPAHFQQKIIMPAGGIPKYYGMPHNKHTAKSPHIIVNPAIAKQPEPIDKNKIKNNMNNMKALMEKRGFPRKPFMIEPSNYYIPDQGYSHEHFMDTKKMFEPKKTNNMNKVYESKPVRKDIKKKAKNTFHG